MGAHPVVQVTAFTHQGLVRHGNEDTMGVGEWVRNASMFTPHQWRFALETPLLCVVADGMGGHAAGEEASRYAVTGLCEKVSAMTHAEKLGEVLQEINTALYDRMQRDPSRVGMGTTVVGTILFPDRLLWFNIGDSRLYRHRNGFLRQLSIDDVPDTTMADHDGAKRQSSAITQSLGGTKTLQRPNPHIESDELAVPSRWLVCSDGLTDMVDIDAMEECMALPDLEAVSRLVDLAMQAGGEDNVSIIILSVMADKGVLSLSV